MKGFAQQVVELPVILTAGADQGVNLAIRHQAACLAVIGKVHQQLRLGDLCRDKEIASGSGDRRLCHPNRLSFPVGRHLFQLPLFQLLPVFVFLPFGFYFDQGGVAVRQAAHVVDTALTIGSRGYLDGKKVGINSFAVIYAPYPRQTSAEHRTSGKQRHVTLAAVGVKTDGITQQRRYIRYYIFR